MIKKTWDGGCVKIQFYFFEITDIMNTNTCSNFSEKVTFHSIRLLVMDIEEMYQTGESCECDRFH